ncbi:MAG: hypothetical protein KAH30_06465 [Caldisericia bacterium]|nr:hypothetical protein [Caldisericia bacterium]
MIERNGYFYFRTHLDLPPQYKTWETGTEFSYTFTDVVTPDDIPNFKQKELICALKPFDGKNYTFCNPILTGEDDFKVTWSLLNVGEFDSIAFGSIICEKVDIKVTTIPEADGSFEILSELNGYPVDNTLHSESDIVYPSTVVLYMDKMISRESVIEVTIHGKGEVQIGEILGAKSIDGGFTKPSFKNTFKDFSPKEQDQWGNWTYIDGVKVQVHSGTVEFPILRYDQLNRLMLLMGGSKVVVNSSDSIKNEIPDGRSIFEATMMIARFTKFNLDSSEKNKRIGESGKYTFSIEEIV